MSSPEENGFIRFISGLFVLAMIASCFFIPYCLSQDIEESPKISNYINNEWSEKLDKINISTMKFNFGIFFDKGSVSIINCDGFIDSFFGCNEIAEFYIKTTGPNIIGMDDLFFDAKLLKKNNKYEFYFNEKYKKDISPEKFKQYLDQMFIFIFDDIEQKKIKKNKEQIMLNKWKE
jgi:hypothetical protein